MRVVNAIGVAIATGIVPVFIYDATPFEAPLWSAVGTIIATLAILAGVAYYRLSKTPAKGPIDD
ncbi:MAG: hypothetical protein ACRDWF_11525 [Acidimicrobiia bacterium]